MRGWSLSIAGCVCGVLAVVVSLTEAVGPGDLRWLIEHAKEEPAVGRYPRDRYVIGTGYGDLTKGARVCRRVAELSARADLAKQIRVMVKERMVDRVRERSGRDVEQDIELTREEVVQEYLQGVQIVDYRVDEDTHMCSATAVMAKA